MKNVFIKSLIIILFFLSLGTNIYAATLENFIIDIDKEIVHPNEEVTLKIDFGKVLSEFEINIAYDRNLFEYFSTDKDINLYDNGDIVTLTYPTLSTTEPLKEISVTFKAKDNIITTNPTNFKTTLQNMKDGISAENLENPLLPIEKNIIVEPIYKEYKFDLEFNELIIPNEESNMKLILKSDMGQSYTNTRIYARIVSDIEGEAQITAIDFKRNKV